jgi:hypothetical protein
MPATIRTRLSGVWHSLRLPQIAAGMRPDPFRTA